jgi:hypothetical protein
VVSFNKLLVFFVLLKINLCILICAITIIVIVVITIIIIIIVEVFTGLIIIVVPIILGMVVMFGHNEERVDVKEKAARAKFPIHFYFSN